MNNEDSQRDCINDFIKFLRDYSPIDPTLDEELSNADCILLCEHDLQKTIQLALRAVYKRLDELGELPDELRRPDDPKRLGK